MKKLQTILKSRYFTAFLFLTIFALLISVACFQSLKVAAYQEKYKKDLEIQLQLVEKVNQLNNELMEEEYLVIALREDLVEIEQELEDERNDLLTLTGWSYKYKGIDKALRETASKDWKDTQPTPCVSSTTHLQKQIKELGVLLIRITGTSTESKKAHEIGCIAVEPQTGQLIKILEFQPDTLSQNYNNLEFQTYLKSL